MAEEGELFKPCAISCSVFSGKKKGLTRIQVQGIALGQWGVHESLYAPKSYQVTETTTGYWVDGGMARTDAMRLAQALCSLGDIEVRLDEKDNPIWDDDAKKQRVGEIIREMRAARHNTSTAELPEEE